MAHPVLYRALSKILREQSGNLHFTKSWPRWSGLRGLAAASGLCVDLGGGDRNLVMLEWEDLLQREEVRRHPAAFLRLFFDDSAHARGEREAMELEFPTLARELVRPDPLDRGFAAMRLASEFSELITDLEDIEIVDMPPSPRERPDHLLFAVGDVLEHRFFGKCVVTGWDETCQQDEDWVEVNNIRKVLKFGTEQPFYNVLLERDEMPRYCSQENLMLDQSQTPHAFSHPHAPYYFMSSVDGERVVPSEALDFVYPEDAAVASGERNYRTLDEAHEEEESS